MISSDTSGMIKVWDVRMNQCLQTTYLLPNTAQMSEAEQNMRVLDYTVDTKRGHIIHRVYLKDLRRCRLYVHTEESPAPVGSLKAHRDGVQVALTAALGHRALGHEHRAGRLLSGDGGGGGGQGGLGPQNLCTQNGPTRFSRL